MVVDFHDGYLLPLLSGDKVRVCIADDRSTLELHAITPGGTVLLEVTPEEAAQLAVALLRERSLVVNGSG